MDRETYLQHRDRAGEGHDTAKCPVCKARRRTIEETIRQSRRVRAAIKATFRPERHPTVKVKNQPSDLTAGEFNRGE